MATMKKTAYKPIINAPYFLEAVKRDAGIMTILAAVFMAKNANPAKIGPLNRNTAGPG